MSANLGKVLVAKEEVLRFIRDCVQKVGVSASHAGQLADVLVAGDYRGHYSHGLNRIDVYVLDVKKGVCRTEGEPVVLQERAATAWVDGRNLLGPVVGNFCMELAMRKAAEAGIGWVSARGSNHYGIAGHYAMQALEKGMLGMSFTNTSPFAYPTRAAQAALGTNPLSLAAPASRDSFVLDMATTSVAVGKVEMQSRKGEPIPRGWAVDGGGQETTDPAAVLSGGGLLPLGGGELTAGYKGYGLAMMVEIFCGILGGANWGPNIRKWMTTKEEANLGQCFVAIDPTAFGDGFECRMQDLIDSCRNLKRVDDEVPVLVAGDPEREHMALCDSLGAIPYHPNQIDHSKSVAFDLNVKPLTTSGIQ